MTDDPPEPSKILADTDWARREQAHGSAFPETPAKLSGLTSGDPDAVRAALSHLGDSLLHQGTVFSATAPAARYVAALLGDPRSRNSLTPVWEKGRYPLRARLLTWLAGVANEVSESSEQRIRSLAGYPETEPFPLFQEIRKLYPEIFVGVSTCVDDPDPAVREAALVAAVRLLESPELAARRQELVPAVRQVLAVSAELWRRRVAVEALAAWGEEVDSLSGTVSPEPDDDDLWGDAWEPGKGPDDKPPF